MPLKYLLKGVLTATKNRRSMTDQKQGEIYANEVKQEVALEVEVKNSVVKIESCVLSQIPQKSIESKGEFSNSHQKQ